eukprot:1138197-Pelagomonas_calceolata.AAC.2
MKELRCYTDEHRCNFDDNDYWACPACAHLNDDDKLRRESGSLSTKELVVITLEPSWESEDTKETWPTFLQRSFKFETNKDEPDLSIPAAGPEIDNLEGNYLTKQTAIVHKNKN